jgi:hypothetical protein
MSAAIAMAAMRRVLEGRTNKYQADSNFALTWHEPWRLQPGNANREIGVPRLDHQNFLKD